MLTEETELVKAQRDGIGGHPALLMVVANLWSCRSSIVLWLAHELKPDSQESHLAII